MRDEFHLTQLHQQICVARLTRTSGKTLFACYPKGGLVRNAVEELLDTSDLDNEHLQIAIRMAHNNLRERKRNFKEFVSEGAHQRIIQYSHLHLLFAQIIVVTLNAESDHRYSLDVKGDK